MATPPASVPIPTPGDIATGTKVVLGNIPLPGVDQATALVDSATAVRRWISDRHNWVRVGWFVGGSLLLWAGVVVLARKPIIATAQGAGTAVKDTAIAGAIL
jgi:hypothetical protein